VKLKDKIAIVTGAASGFGEGIATRFAQEGAHVVVADIDAVRGEAIVTKIADAGGSALLARTDVTVNDDVKAMVDKAVSAFGGLDIMVNNAGMAQINQPMLDVDETTYDRLFEVNCKSVYLSALHTVPVLRERGGGVIINTASTAALRPRPGLAWYNSTKGAVVVMTKSMAVELAPDKIRVNALCPVAGDTPMLGAFLGGEVTNEMYDKFVSTVPLGRLSTPKDIANVAAFLASDEAEFLTGLCMEVDGGRCI
jgi:3-oxoacyl-[acyl-carrier protein] reductase